MGHLEEVSVSPDGRSAYRTMFSSATTTICSVVDDLLEMTERGKCVVLALLDLSAAFDTAVHELLIKDLRNTGVVDKALKYLESCL